MTTPTPLAVPFSRDEQARQAAVTSLRTHVLTRMAGAMREHFNERVEPEFERLNGRAPANGTEVRKAMRNTRAFRFYSAVRHSAQEMVYASVIPGIERHVDALAETSADLRRTGGSLELDPELEIPRNVAAIDVHHTPGGYHPEYRDDDVAAGAVYDSALDIFAFGQFGEHLDDIGMTMANFVRLRFPELQPAKILDCGCTVGHNTLPWAQTFPDAQVFGIDVAPGPLRYASARAAALGVPVHFRQMDATRLKFADESVDVVFSSMFLHELPLADIRQHLREAFRVLRPGGLLWIMELPPNSAMGAYEGFYLDWDSYYNNEPFYKPFRDQDYRALCEAAGFASDHFLEATLPRYTFVGEQAFREALDGPARFDNRTGRMDPKGTRWYGFGARKSSTDSTT